MPPCHWKGEAICAVLGRAQRMPPANGKVKPSPVQVLGGHNECLRVTRKVKASVQFLGGRNECLRVTGKVKASVHYSVFGRAQRMPPCHWKGEAICAFFRQAQLVMPPVNGKMLPTVQFSGRQNESVRLMER